ncbi:MAG: bifunctional nuclease family protein [Prevotellaceae bacterium]|jgi:bifunctional DNase/RNase|nr:bifunctional nuclease family protein [Prevotellaceae bacterium]
MDDEIKIRIVGLIYNQRIAGTYALVLSEVDGNRRFSVMLGNAEAQLISLKLNNKISARPLTYDLISNLLTTLGATLEKAVIYDIVNDVFYSELHLRYNNEIIVLDARTSDAVALAVCCDVPIFIRREILNIVGIAVENESGQHGQHRQRRQLPDDLDQIEENDLQRLTNDELTKLLNRALACEKYELAVMIRNQANKR